MRVTFFAVVLVTCVFMFVFWLFEASLMSSLQGFVIFLALSFLLGLYVVIALEIWYGPITLTRIPKR